MTSRRQSHLGALLSGASFTETRRGKPSWIRRPPFLVVLSSDLPFSDSRWLSFGFEFTGAVLEVGDLRDAGDVDAMCESSLIRCRRARSSFCVSAGATISALRGQRSAPFVEPRRLRINPTQLRARREGVDAARRPREGIIGHQTDPFRPNQVQMILACNCVWCYKKVMAVPTDLSDRQWVRRKRSC